MKTATEKAIDTLANKRYVRVSKKLAERSAEVAREIRDKMQELEIKTLQIPNVGTLEHLECRTNAGWYSILHWAEPDGYPIHNGDLEWSSLGDGDTGEYVHGDYHHFRKKPTRDEVLKLALNIEVVFAELDAVENRNADKCEEALKALSK